MKYLFLLLPLFSYGQVQYQESYGYKPDTSNVIYVLLTEVTTDMTIDDKPLTYPIVNAKYGYLIYRFGKGNTYFDDLWQSISEEEILFIRKRKLRK